MLIIVAGSQRGDSKSYKVGKLYKAILLEEQIHADIFSLEDLPSELILISLQGLKSPKLNELTEGILSPHEKIIFIMPEFNGSFPGLLKLFIDACDKDAFTGKRAALVGISAGRAGNLRGMDHLTDILHHIGMEVMSNKVPISSISKIMNVDGSFKEEETVNILRKQVKQFLKF